MPLRSLMYVGRAYERLVSVEELREYTEFMECVEKHRATGADNAMELAVKECIKNGILKKYLERKGSEVVNMLIAEYDYATDIRIQREEAAAQGIENEIFRSVFEKDYSLERGAEKLNLSKEQFEEKYQNWLKERNKQ